MEVRTRSRWSRAREPAPLPVSLVYKGPAPLTRKMQVFIDFAAMRLRDSLARSSVRTQHLEM